MERRERELEEGRERKLERDRGRKREIGRKGREKCFTVSLGCKEKKPFVSLQKFFFFFLSIFFLFPFSLSQFRKCSKVQKSFPFLLFDFFLPSVLNFFLFILYEAASNTCYPFLYNITCLLQSYFFWTLRQSDQVS